jgi:hypothetical protein
MIPTLGIKGTSNEKNKPVGMSDSCDAMHVSPQSVYLSRLDGIYGRNLQCQTVRK